VENYKTDSNNFVIGYKDGYLEKLTGSADALTIKITEYNLFLNQMLRLDLNCSLLNNIQSLIDETKPELQKEKEAQILKSIRSINWSVTRILSNFIIPLEFKDNPRRIEEYFKIFDIQYNNFNQYNERQITTQQIQKNINTTKGRITQEIQEEINALQSTIHLLDTEEIVNKKINNFFNVFDFIPKLQPDYRTKNYQAQTNHTRRKINHKQKRFSTTIIIGSIAIVTVCLLVLWYYFHSNNI
jgi:hypothetical protein